MPAAEGLLRNFIIDGCVLDRDGAGPVHRLPGLRQGRHPLTAPIRMVPARSTSLSAWADRSSARGDILVGDGDSILVIKPEDAESRPRPPPPRCKVKRGQLPREIPRGQGLSASFVDQILEQIGVGMSIKFPISASLTEGGPAPGRSPFCSLSAVQYSPRSHSPYHLHIRRNQEAVPDLTAVPSP